MTQVCVMPAQQHRWGDLVHSPAFGPARTIMRAFVALVFAIWLIAAPPTPCAAQPQDRTALAGQVELSRLVDLAADRLHVKLEYDTAALKAGGSVTLRLDSALSDAELWSLTNRVLAERGFTTVLMPGGVGYSVLKITD